MSEDKNQLVLINDAFDMVTEANDNLTHHQEQIRSLHRKIDILQKRLNDTKTFCDSLWNQLKDYE